MIQPLDGIRVLEWGAYHAGPGGTAILGDLGAEVIKIEQPNGGDPSRNSFLVNRSSFRLPNGESLWNECANRSKKSITIDLNREEGREIAYRLAAKSDVFLTNFRRQRVGSLKMGYEAISAVSPRIIYAWVSAYGPEGPDRDLGGFDYQGQGRSGLMWTVGEEGMPPLVSQFGILDQATAIMASHQILTALLMRERQGIGQEVHVSVLSTGIFLHYTNAFSALVGDLEVPRHVRTREHPTRNYYRCADDKWLIMTVAAHKRQQQWPKLCEVLGHPELIDDPRFNSDENRLKNAPTLVPLLDEIFMTRPRDEWLQALKGNDFVCCEVNRPTELKDDPQIMANGYITEFEHPDRGKIMIPGYPVRFSESWAGTRSAAPRLGANTEEILSEIGGYSADEIAQLKFEGIV
ncbi:MAG: CoA transferase [Dehalococcoidia bacterium]